MWPWTSKQPDPIPEDLTDRALASRLLQMAARLLDSTSSGPSTASSSPSRPPRPLPRGYTKRTGADVQTVTRDRRLVLQSEEVRNTLPPQVRDPAPLPADQQSSGKTPTGGFSATTGASKPTGPGTTTDASVP